MKCQNCNGNTRVMHTRKEDVLIKRWRICVKCDHSFVTYEEAEPEQEPAKPVKPTKPKKAAVKPKHTERTRRRNHAA